MDKIKNFFKSFVQKLKENKKFRIGFIVIAAVVLVLIAAIIVICVSCGNAGGTVDPNETTANTDNISAGETVYSVTVCDPLGNPCSGVIVNFLSDGAVVAMQTVNDQGVAEKTLPTGEYTVELAFTDSSIAYYCYSLDSTLTETHTGCSFTVSLALTGEPKTLSAYSDVIQDSKSYDAYNVGVGCTYVTLDTEDRTYFIFTPVEDGLYEFSLPGSDAVIGYYGNTYFVQSNNLAEMSENGTFTIDVSPGMVNLEGSTASIVIGVDGGGASECIISIQRVGDHVMTIEDYPWDIYQTTAELAAFTLPEGTTLVDFDVTAPTGTYNLVYNEADGFYHLDSEDGPVVYMKLGVDSAYLDSIQTVLDNSGIVRYNFDENGEFISKESYTECLMEYIEHMDQTAGVYPLTEDLKYIILQRGEYVGWWDKDGDSFLFVDENGVPVPGLNPDNAWLFLCCYAETEEVDVTEPTNPDNTHSSGGNANGGSNSNTGGNSGDNNGSSNGGSSGGNSSTQPNKKPQDDPEEKEIGKKSDLVYETGMAEEQESEVIKAGEYVEYVIWRYNSAFYLTIESEDAYVIFNNTVYWPGDDGVLSISIPAPSTLGGCLTIYIGNSGSKDQSFTLEMGSKVGSMSNPKVIKLDSGKQAKVTVSLTSEDTQGYWCTYTATDSGTFSIKLDSSVAAEIILNNNSTYEQVLLSEFGGDTVSIEVKAGDVISITVSLSSTSGSGNNFEVDYEAATIKFTASLKP